MIFQKYIFYNPFFFKRRCLAVRFVVCYILFKCESYRIVFCVDYGYGSGNEDLPTTCELCLNGTDPACGCTEPAMVCPLCHRPWDGFRTCICKLDTELIVCVLCFRFWDGCAQCTCNNCLVCGIDRANNCLCCEENETEYILK